MSPLSHVSFSSVNSFLYCGKQFELEKIKKVPQVPAWFLIGGSAFHSATEVLDTPGEEHPDLWSMVFEDEIAKAEHDSGIDRCQFRAAGKTKSNPDGQDYEFWNTLGPQMLRDYIAWNHGGRTLLYKEESLEEQFDFSALPFRGYVDNVYDDLIVDLKTGTSTPKNGMQLGFYRAGLLMKYGEAPDYGAYYKAREGKLTKEISLHKYTPDYVGKILDSLRRGVEARAFIPNESFSCNSCSVRSGCYTVGGAQSHLYDSLDPNYAGP